MAQLQSSPPTRAWERAGSPDGSQYSLDLAALDLDSHSDMSTPLPEPHVDKVLSEDIDGPSDFTLNMEKWMRGGTLQKGTVRSAMGVEHAIEEEENQHSDEEGLLKPPHEGDVSIGKRTASMHTPKDSPQRDHGYRNEQFDGDVQLMSLDHEAQDSSTWDPYASTPHPNEQNHMLQPTVEDYHSELTPARLASTQRSLSQRQPETVQEEDEAPSEAFSPGRPSSPVLSPVRSPVIVRTASRDMPGFEMQRLQSHVVELQSRCNHLEVVNATLTKALKDEQEVRKAEASAHESELREKKNLIETKLRDAARREQDLTEMKEAAYRHNDDFRSEFSRLKQRLHDREAEVDELRRINVDHDGALQDLQRELEAERDRHDRERSKLTFESVEKDERISELEKEAQTLRNREKHIQDANESSQQQAAHDAGSERLRTEATHTHDLAKNISDLRVQLEGTMHGLSKLHADKREADEAAVAAQNWMRDFRDHERQRTLQLEAEKIKAVELADSLHGELNRLREQMRVSMLQHDSALAILRAELEIARTQDSEGSNQMITKLNEATIERDLASDEASALRTELENVKTELEEIKTAHLEVNSVLDEKLTAAILRRERAWEEKVDYLMGERAQMAKELLRYWGRDEVGKAFEGALQPYEYKFSKRMKTPKGVSLLKTVRETA